MSFLRHLRSVFQQKSEGISNYEIGPTYDGIGAGAAIFLQHFQNPLYLVRGPGRVPVSSLRVLQRPQVYFLPTVTVVGVGGVQAGQIILQPLTDQTGQP
jgi:hypothetical protein